MDRIHSLPNPEGIGFSRSHSHKDLQFDNPPLYIMGWILFFDLFGYL